VSRASTNIVRIVVATLLALSACLVAWWPQSASAGSDAVAAGPAQPMATQKTPTATPTKTPTATVQPTQQPTVTVAPAPPPPAPAPTKKPTHHSSGGNGNGNGGSHHSSGNGHTPAHHSSGGHTSGSHPSGHHSSPSSPATHSTSTGSTGSTGSTSSQTQAPAPVTSPGGGGHGHTAAPTTPAAAPSPSAHGTKNPSGKSTDGAKTADENDTYLSSAEPVQTKSAPVWVVPGILLVLTSMLALLGGVLGRQNRPAPVVVETPTQPVRRPRPRPEGDS
jgi:type IV secretory pathway VirB10-like protein